MNRAEIEALSIRLDELETVANDAYDIAAGIIHPGITDLAPPETPTQEVFGGGAMTAAWSVRMNAGAWQVYDPQVVTPSGIIRPAGMSEGWNALSVTSGTLYAVIDATGESVRLSGSAESECINVRIGEWQDGAWKQSHIGAIVFAGSGGSGSSLTLGGLEEYDGQLAQFVGTWSIVEGTPVFVPASDTPAVIYASEKVKVAFRVTDEHAGTDALETAEAFLLFPGDSAPWMSTNKVTYAKNITYTEPASQTEKGALSATHATIDVLSPAAPTVGEQETLLETVVEAANESKIYEA